MGNLKVLRRTRKPICAGDIFAMQVEEGHYLFGRVIRTDAMLMDIKDCILIYIFRAVSRDKHVIPALDKDNLLVAPILTGPYMWTKGYFETVEHRSLTSHDVLPQHCFHSIRWGASYMDADNNRLPGRTEPCGSYAITLSQGIDRAVSRALGLEAGVGTEGNGTAHSSPDT